MDRCSETQKSILAYDVGIKSRLVERSEEKSFDQPDGKFKPSNSWFSAASSRHIVNGQVASQLVRLQVDVSNDLIDPVVDDRIT